MRWLSKQTCLLPSLAASIQSSVPSWWKENLILQVVLGPLPFTHGHKSARVRACTLALTHTPLPYANKSGRQGIYENAKSRHIYEDRQLSHREKI